MNVTVSKFEGRWAVKANGRVVGYLDPATQSAVENALLNDRLLKEGCEPGAMRPTK